LSCEFFGDIYETEFDFNFFRNLSNDSSCDLSCDFGPGVPLF